MPSPRPAPLPSALGLAPVPALPRGRADERGGQVLAETGEGGPRSGTRVIFFYFNLNKNSFLFLPSLISLPLATFSNPDLSIKSTVREETNVFMLAAHLIKLVISITFSHPAVSLGFCMPLSCMLPAALELPSAPLLFAEEEVCAPGAPSPSVQIPRSGPCQKVTGDDLVSSGFYRLSPQSCHFSE